MCRRRNETYRYRAYRYRPGAESEKPLQVVKVGAGQIATAATAVCCEGLHASARGSARCVGLHTHMVRACGEGVIAHRMASMTWVVLCAFSLSGRARVETRNGWGSCARAVVAFEWNTCSPPPALAPAECEMECGGSAENCEMRNGWGFFGHACGWRGKP